MLKVDPREEALTGGEERLHHSTAGQDQFNHDLVALLLWSWLLSLLPPPETLFASPNPVCFTCVPLAPPSALETHLPSLLCPLLLSHAEILDNLSCSLHVLLTSFWI